MQQKVMQCPDAARILAQYDLNMQSYQQGIDLICQNQGCTYNPLHTRDVRKPLTMGHLDYDSQGCNVEVWIGFRAGLPVASRQIFYSHVEVRVGEEVTIRAICLTPTSKVGEPEM
jgi:hypothetical protein